MALDQIPNTGREIRFTILRNVGNAYVRLGQFQDAILQYEGIMDGNPDVRTGFNLIICYYALGDAQKMSFAFERLLEVSYNGADELDDEEPMGELDEDENDDLQRDMKERQEEASQLVIKAAKLIAPVVGPDIAAGFDFVIQCVRASSVYSEIVHELEILKAITFLKKKQYNDAIETLKSFEKQDTRLQAIASTNLSFLYFLEGNYKHATRYADTAVKSNRYNAKALVNRGNCYMMSKNYELAKELYTNAMNVDAECTEAFYNLGLASKKLAQYEEALAAFTKLNSIVPNNPEVLFQIAVLHDMMGDTSNALETFTILISLVPTDPSVLAKVGELYHKMGEESLALQFYLESYRYYPVNIDVISYLGSYYLQMGVYEKAIGFFRRASQIQPEKVVWPLRVAKCQTQHKDLQGALRTLERANSSFPNESDCLLQLIKVCEGLNLNEKAREYKRQWQKIDRKGGSKSSVDDTFDFSASASTTSSNAGTSSSSRRASPAGFGTSMSTGTSNNSHGMDYGSSSSSSTSFGNDFGSAKNSSPASGGYGSGSGSGSGMGMGLGSMSSSSSSSSSSPKFGGASSGLDRSFEMPKPKQQPTFAPPPEEDDDDLFLDDDVDGLLDF
eukprot:TRINITY_DN2314_c0_g2_i7.p1 TRINITY_DN2314_c0_g2~~TRINITY_DN2314_c0_g2_i7.p1  ORF type:complete len:617 (+),score=258.94 TRINITY_DN2314_c0_g2_i7:426-2276(+)